jgi:hypothetical protein
LGSSQPSMSVPLNALTDPRREIPFTERTQMLGFGA